MALRQGLCTDGGQLDALKAVVEESRERQLMIPPQDQGTLGVLQVLQPWRTILLFKLLFRSCLIFVGLW